MMATISAQTLCYFLSRDISLPEGAIEKNDDVLEIVRARTT